MKLLTPEIRAKEAAEQYKAQYKSGANWMKNSYGFDSEATYEKLVALKDPTPESVAKIIGHSSRTDTCCDECGREGIVVVELGETDGCESRTATICTLCLGVAHSTAKKASSKVSAKRRQASGT